MKPPANGDSEDLENLVGVVGSFFADWDPGNNCRSMDSSFCIVRLFLWNVAVALEVLDR